MKRVLWLVTPQENWMATECCTMLAPSLRAEGFDIVCPIPPPENVGWVRLAAHYWKCLHQPNDLVHAFDRTSALMAMLVRGTARKVCLDLGLATQGKRNLNYLGIPTVSWGPGADIPWPPAHMMEKNARMPHGSFVGFDSSEWAPSIVESVVWSLEIARQVVPQVQLAAGRGVLSGPLVRFAHAVGATGALANISCEEALANGALKGILLGQPDRRVLELAANALKRGVRVAWVANQISSIEAQWPASDPPLVWRDRTGLARLLLKWGQSGTIPEKLVATSTVIESTRAVAAIYRGVFT